VLAPGVAHSASVFSSGVCFLPGSAGPGDSHNFDKHKLEWPFQCGCYKMMQIQSQLTGYVDSL